MNPYSGVSPVGKRALDAALFALAALESAGFIVKRADGSFVTRTLQEGTGVNISNPAGEAGDPTISVDASEIDHGLLTGLGDDDHPQYVLHTEVDDTPINGATNDPISSNWAFDHLAAPDPHPGYLTPAEGDAAYSPLGHNHDHGTLTGLGDNDHPQYLLVADIDDVPVNGVTNAPISSNWAFDHLAAADPHPGYLTQAEADVLYAALIHNHDHGALTGLSDNDHPQYLLVADIDDVPVNGVVNAPISSNWAFDHVAAADPHTQYLLESAYTAADVLAKLLTVDGAGSGLDADLLDGNSSAAFSLVGHTHDTLANIATSTILGRITTGSGLSEELTPAQVRSLINVEDGATADQSAAEILSLLLTVDGAASGLDADLLDGQHGSFYLARGNHTGTQLASTISDFAEAAQDAVYGILVDSATIDFTYNDVGNTMTAIVIDDSISNAKLRNSAAVSVIGRSANSVGDPADIAAGANDTLLRRTGDTLNFGALTIGMIANDLITYAKIQNVVTNQKVLGRTSGAGGDIEELSVSQILDWISSTRGSILYRGASGWAALAPGTAGHALTSNGAGADPSYAAAGEQDFYLNDSELQVAESLTIPSDHNLVLAGEILVAGTLTVNGTFSMVG